MKKFKLFLLLLISFSCNKNFENNTPIIFNINHFDVPNNKMEVSLSITNNSNEVWHENNWSLHWNQLIGTIDPKTLPEGISYKHVTGQGYLILDFGKNYSLAPQKTLKFNFIQKGIIPRVALGPLGAFIKNHKNNNLYDLPLTLIWKQAKGLKDLDQPSPENTFNLLSDQSILPKEEINWVIPTPRNFIYKKMYTSSIKNLIINSPEEIIIDTFFLAKRLEKENSFKVEFSKIKNANVIVSYNQALAKEEYSLEIKEKKIIINASKAAGVFYALESLHQILIISEREKKGLPIISIKDSPRFEFRGFMLDISRNFYELNKVKQVLDYMAHFKLNKLDIRLTDDEGWRLEIPDLPELTEVGSKRGYTKDEKDKLIPMYGSGALSNNSGSGYYTKNDFVEILKYAEKRNIEVIPQISFPSHARAAIKSMESRYENFITINENKEENRFKAELYLISDPQDKSTYISAQGYSDNVINICNENAYRFFEKIVYEVNQMYKSANIPFKIFNIAADELPYGVWQKSSICDDFYLKNENLRDVNKLYENNLIRLNKIINKYGAKMAGWEDIVLKHTEKSHEETQIRSELLNLNIIPYVWNNNWGSEREDMAYRLSNMGYKTIMSNSSAFYFDMVDDKDFESLGLNWSGFVNYKDMWGTEPLNVFANQESLEKHKISKEYISKRTSIKKSAIKNFLGIQSQLWSETIINEEIFDKLFMPNLPIFAERAWSKEEYWVKIDNPEKQKIEINKSWNLFSNSLVRRHLLFMNRLYGGLKYDLPKPGAKISNDTLYAKSKLPGLIIRYTTDGSIPNERSKSYSNPLKIINGSNIKLKTFDSYGRGGNTIEVKN